MKSFRSKVTVLFFFTGILMLAIFGSILYFTSMTLVNFALGFAISLLLGALIIYLALAPLSSHFKMLLYVTGKSIEGDLSEQIEDKQYGWGEIDQITHNTRKILKGVHKWFGMIKEHSDSLNEASNQIVSGTNQVSLGSQEQAEQVQHILLAIEDLARSSKEAAVLSREASDTAKICNTTAHSGGKSIERTITVMNDINDKITRLDQQSVQISQFLTLINDIASQTNLLALNAAIEAARAGHQGHGFSVVADEVRRLAENSARATEEIAKIIGEVKSSIEKTTTTVESGLNTTGEIGEAIKTIVSQIQATTERIEKIAEFSAEQALTTERMAENIESISAVAQEATATSQETAAITKNLFELGQKISQVADIWKFA